MQISLNNDLLKKFIQGNFMGLKVSGRLKYTLLIIFIFLIWTYFPFIFRFLMNWMGWLGTDLKGFSEFGAIGDIYGSLNTLISSLALCAVAYSTILQVNELKLARQTYVDQLNEAKYSNFSGLFYSLLQSKQQSYNYLKLEDRNGETYIGQYMLAVICTEFMKYLKKYLDKDSGDFPNLTKKELRYFFTKELMIDYKGSIDSELLAYFSNYATIVNLISKADLKDKDKEFFIGILRDNMSIYEQVILLAISATEDDLKLALSNSRIIKTGYQGVIFEFIKKFHHPNMFADSDLVSRLSP
ncbi:putative phage abortive infection protein [Acinetobacter baumannii]|uniref:putative phage abortive infection protein n=1 Tax=Acinetobacter baumannii TaxID=470 RepID=UPI00321A268A